MRTESVGDERAERIADVVPYDQIGEIIELGRFAIDDHESRAVPFGH
jgi:hypothetical protein